MILSAPCITFFLHALAETQPYTCTSLLVLIAALSVSRWYMWFIGIGLVDTIVAITWKNEYKEHQPVLQQTLLHIFYSQRSRSVGMRSLIHQPLHILSWRMQQRLELTNEKVWVWFKKDVRNSFIFPPNLHWLVYLHH